MPAASMCISSNSLFRLKQHLICGLLKRPFFLTDTQRMNLAHSFNLLPDTSPGHPGLHYAYPQSDVPLVYGKLSDAQPAADSLR